MTMPRMLKGQQLHRICAMVGGPKRVHMLVNRYVETMTRWRVALWVSLQATCTGTYGQPSQLVCFVKLCRLCLGALHVAATVIVG